MSRMYLLSDHSDVIIKELEKKRIDGLKLEYRPHDINGQPSLWPYGVTDGECFAWFEVDMLLVWGVRDETRILQRLRRAGFGTKYMG